MSDDLFPDDPAPGPPESDQRALEDRRLDELLSADLDGELDAAARDLGMTIDDARAAIRTPVGADRRRGALAAAREQLAQLPEIDELVAQRLRAKAVRAAEAEHREQAETRRQRHRVLAGAGAVAAAILAVAAIAVVLNTHGTDNTSSKSASTPVFRPAQAPSTTASPKAAATGLLALGSFADVRTLGEAAVVQAATAPPSAPVGHNAAPGEGTNTTPAPASSGAAATSSIPATTGGPAFSKATQNESQSAASTCTSPPPDATGDRLVLHATATLAGQPVIVLVFAGAGEHVVVIDRPNCTLVNLQQLR